jgi:CubicO group peptidase (beta-lactamase class C family)
MDPQTPSASMADMGLFTGAPQHENFARFRDFVPARVMAPSAAPFAFPRGPALDLPAIYDFEGSTKSFEDFFTETDTAALLVLQDGAVRCERYALTGGPDTQWISWSVAKSFVSALVGIAISEGHIHDIDDPISDYITVSPGSAYDGVPIRHVLQMSSGARWKEDYSDPESDIIRLGMVMAGVSTLDAFVADMTPENAPGTVCRYNSADTQALGALLIQATKRSLSDYMQEKLSEPLGFAAPGYWVLDNTGMEMAFAGLLLTPHDFAKIGELYRNGGVWNGTQVVPADWARTSITANGPHVQPDRVILNDHTLPFGYGYQWWLPKGDLGEFSAIGIYNQFVYVDPSRGVVIVKLSSNRAYGTSPLESTNHEIETIAFLRAIAQHCD